MEITTDKHARTFTFNKYAVFFNIGYPQTFGHTHLGLYQPVLKRFLLTLCDLEHARSIKMHLSSRYTLCVCDLTTATNYAANLIDNHCCENWDISNSRDLFIPQPFDMDTVCAVEVLRPAAADLDQDIMNEKNYLHVTWYWLDFVRHLGRKWDAASRFVASVMQVPNLDPRLDLMQRIQQQIYFNHDSSVLHAACEHMVNQSDYTGIYRSWQAR